MHSAEGGFAVGVSGPAERDHDHSLIWTGGLWANKVFFIFTISALFLKAEQTMIRMSSDTECRVRSDRDKYWLSNSDWRIKKC